MRAQDDIIGDVKCVLHIAGRVLARDIQGFEVIVIQLHLGSLGDAEAEPVKNLLYFLQDLGEGVLMSPGGDAAGQGDIERLAEELALELSRLYFGQTRGDELFN